MFSNDFNNSRPYDSTIGYTRHSFRLFRLGNTEANGYRNICVFANGFNDGFNIRFNFATHTGNAQGRYTIHETFRFFCNHFDAIFRCWGNQGYYFNTMLMSNCSKFTFFFKRHIRHNNARNANLFTEGKEFFTTEYIDRIQIGHEYEWHCHRIITTAQTAYHIEDIVNFYTCRQCTRACLLDNWAFRCRVRERNTDFHHISASFHHDANIPFRVLNTMVTSTNKWDECLALCESIFNFTHEDPPLCISP